MFQFATRLVLSPLLIAQALGVRRIAQILPEATGPRDGVTGTGEALRLRIIGDSSAAGVGASIQDEALLGQLTSHLGKQFEVSWHLDAITGATTRSTLERLNSATPTRTDIIVLALGVNDATRLIPPARWLKRHRALLDRLRTLYQPRHIYLSGMPPLGRFPLLPQPLRWTLGQQATAIDNVQIRHAARVDDLTHVPFDLDLDPDLMASDGFHPNPRLYAIWGKAWQIGSGRTGQG
ncbi:SGNH/GDSL hydrolase family protein [Sulfitobacter aestuariivivens]|uniref:SGNH/GDSL hydrolase family protein n=1 Tax=Sulfitobacter aestuariivivens TaxID=2766981 RepID=UPI00360C1823